MSDTVDNVLDAVTEAVDEPSVNMGDIVVNDGPVDETVDEPVDETVDEPTDEPVDETVPEEVSVQEVVQNVQEILTTPSNENLTDKERLVLLEKRVDDLVNILRSVYIQSEVDDVKIWRTDLISIREQLNNV